MEHLTIEILKREAAKFLKIESKHEETSIFGSTTGRRLEPILSINLSDTSKQITFLKKAIPLQA